MSLVRLCDCPCHEYDEYLGRIDESEQWATFDGRDVCQWCLSGGPACQYWIPHTPHEPTAFEKQVRAIYEPVLRASLSAQPLFKRLSSES